MRDENEDILAAEIESAARRVWWLKWIGVFFAVIALVLPVVWVGCGWYSGKDLRAEIERYRAAGEPILPEDFDSPPVPDADNGALVIQQAAKQFKGVVSKQTAELNSLFGDPVVIKERRAEVGKYIALSAEARGMARRARSLPASDWRVRYRSPVLWSEPPDLSGDRHLSRMLSIAAIYFHQGGNDAETVESVRDLLGLAAHLDRHPSMMYHLVAIAIGGVAGYCLEDTAFDLRIADDRPDVDALSRPATRAQVRALIGELLDQEPSRRALVRALYAERMLQLHTARSMVRGQMDFAPTPPGKTAPVNAERRAMGLIFRPILERDAVRMMRYTSAWAEAAGQSTWPAFKERTVQRPEVDSALQLATHPVSYLMLTDYERIGQLHFRAMTHRRFAATALAIRLYELDHGRRPETLDELVPKYLPAVPDDPHAADGGKIGYKPNAEPPILYSVNLDGIDQRGEFGLDPEGSVDWEVKDLPFFLNGDRPRPAPTTRSATRTQ